MYFQKKKYVNILLLHHSKHWRSHEQQRSDLECHITKWCDQGKIKKIHKKHSWVLKAYLHKWKKIALAMLLHCASCHSNLFNLNIQNEIYQDTKTNFHLIIVINFQSLILLTTNFAPQLSSMLTMGATFGKAEWQWRLVTCDIVGIQWRWLINVGSTWSGSLVDKMVTHHPCGIMMIFSNLLAQIHKAIRQEFFCTMWQKFTTKIKHW